MESIPTRPTKFLVLSFMFELPTLPPCPLHGHDPSRPLAGCQICWAHFNIPFQHGPELRRIGFVVADYFDRVERAKRLMHLREHGYETDKQPPLNTKVRFALPSGQEVVGKYIDDQCGGSYPVELNETQTEIRTWSGWRYE